MWRACAAAMLLTACGDNVTPTQELYVPFAPVFIAYKMGSTEWKTPEGSAAADGSTTYKLPVYADFELVVVCARANNEGFVTQEAFGTPDDWDNVTGLWPCPAQSSLPTTTLSGRMDPPGAVVTPDGYATSSASTGAWSFQVTAPIGTADIAAIAASNPTELLAVRHHQTITMNMTEPSFDFAHAGDPVQFWTPSIDGVENHEITGAQSLLITKNGTEIFLGFAGASAPPSQLEAGDYQWFWAYFSGNGVSQSLDDFSERPPQRAYTLLPTLSDISFGIPVASASWTSLPDGFAVVDGQFSDDSNFEFVAVGADWLAERNANTIAFDNDVPGLDPMWEVTPVKYNAFSVAKHVGSVWYSSMVGGAGIPAMSNAYLRPPMRHLTTLDAREPGVEAVHDVR